MSNNINSAAALVKELQKKGLTLSFAESCTGGLASATVVSVSGASSVFFGGVVSYDNSVKMGLLSVEKSVLDSVGAVSEECAMQMARGARRAVGTDIAVSATGIAGPSGGTPEKPVGLVYIGIDSPRGTRVKKLLLGELKERTAIRERAVYEMFELVLSEASAL